jgi:hypothetical protein
MSTEGLSEDQGTRRLSNNTVNPKAVEAPPRGAGSRVAPSSSGKQS